MVFDWESNSFKLKITLILLTDEHYYQLQKIQQETHTQFEENFFPLSHNLFLSTKGTLLKIYTNIFSLRIVSFSIQDKNIFLYVHSSQIHSIEIKSERNPTTTTKITKHDTIHPIISNSEYGVGSTEKSRENLYIEHEKRHAMPFIHSV